jgi:N-acyl-D-amino-acid deacylase
MGRILLRAGKVIDGTGKANFIGHILIEGDRIKAVLKDGEALPSADSVIDASSYAIAPGFIDMHSHMDWSLPLDDHPELLKCLLEQGITTLVAGNCGFSPAPVTTETLGLLERELMLPIDKPLDYSWRSMREFLERVEERKPIVNLAELVGHGTVRIAAANTRRGVMKPDELKNCLDTVRRSLDEGACGLSFGLGYDPGLYSPKEEIGAFSMVAAKAKKPVTVHLKTYCRASASYSLLSLKPHNLLALKEMIDIAQRTGISLQVSHFMLAFRKTWPLIDECLKVIENARREGIDIMIDAIPYSDLNGSVVTLLPPWFIAKLPRGYGSRRARVRVCIENPIGYRRVGYSYQSCQLMDAAVEGWDDLSGLTIPEIFNKWKTSPTEVVLKLSEYSKGHAAILCHNVAGETGNENHLDAILSYNLCLFETDTLIKSRGYPNPAAFGAFPKILGYYVRGKKLFSIEDAAKRMTSASADRFGLYDRGRLEPGKAADIVMFDPEIISETVPVSKKPASRPIGICHVFLNGQHVVRDGSYVRGMRAGRVLGV